ncbi:MAG: tetratricopeptide repeat protein [Candidatus Thorarchaeota archaeon]
MSPRPIQRGNHTNWGRVVGSIILYIISLGLVHFLAILLVVFNIAEDYITALGETWLYLELIFSFFLWILSLFQFGKSDSLIIDVGNKIVDRMDYRYRKLLSGQQQIMDIIIDMPEVLEGISDIKEDTGETKDLALEIRDMLKKFDPDMVRRKIQTEFDSAERNLIVDELEKRIKDINVKLLTFRMDVLVEDQASSLEELGRTYWIYSLIRKKEDRLNKALDVLQKALEFHTLKKRPEDSARIQKLIGIVHATYIDVRENKKHCELALLAFRESLKYYSPTNHPIDYVKVMNNIGSVNQKMMEYQNVEDTYNETIYAFAKALAAIDSEDNPVLHALILNNIGATYSKYAQLGLSVDVREYCELAIVAFEKALTIRSLENFRIDYSTTQNNLGIAYSCLAFVHEKKNNYQKAIAAYKRALNVRTLGDLPLYYATTQFNLGRVYLELAKVQDRKINCSLAIEALIETLQIYTIDAYPEKYKKVLRVLEHAKFVCIIH